MMTLNEIRKLRGMTLSEFSRQSGLSPHTALNLMGYRELYGNRLSTSSSHRIVRAMRRMSCSPNAYHLMKTPSNGFTVGSMKMPVNVIWKPTMRW